MPRTTNLNIAESCRENPVYFFEEYCKIPDAKSGKMVPFLGYDFQKDFWVALHRSFLNLNGQEPRHFVWGKTRQCGATWSSVAFSLWLTMFHPNKNVVFMSEKEDLAKEMMNRVNLIYSNLPAQLQFDTILNNTETIWFGKKLKGGKIMPDSINSQIQCIATTESGVQSKTLNLLVVDETASVMRIKEIFQRSAKPALERANGMCIMISTGKPGTYAKGAGKFFQDVYWKAKRDPQYKNVFVPWNAVPGRDKDWYEKSKADAEDERIFLQEYPSTESEMFSSASAQLFNVDMLQKRKEELILHHEPCKRYMLVKGEDGDEAYAFVENPKGRIRVYQEYNREHVYTIGADAASGVGEDNSAVFVRDATTNEEAAVAWGKFRPYEVAVICNHFGRMYGDALVVPEVEMYGLSVLETLRDKLDYPFIYIRRTSGKVEDGFMGDLGWKTTHGNRDKLLQDLYDNVNTGGFKARTIELIDEMLAFEEDESGKATHPPGGHDDMLMACAFSLQGTKYGISDTVGKIGNIEEKLEAESMSWKDAQVLPAERDWRYA